MAGKGSWATTTRFLNTCKRRSHRDDTLPYDKLQGRTQPARMARRVRSVTPERRATSLRPNCPDSMLPHHRAASADAETNHSYRVDQRPKVLRAESVLHWPLSYRIVVCQ